MNFEKDIETSLASRIGAMHWSPSRLEALGTCGFKFFARYGLGLPGDDDPGLEIGSAERGTLVHRTLETLFHELYWHVADRCPAAKAARSLSQQQLPLSFSRADPGGRLQRGVDKPLEVRTARRTAADCDAGAQP